MKRKVVTGYLNSIVNKNALENLHFEDVELLHQVKLGCEDYNGFEDARTLEVLYSKKHDDFMLIVGSTHEQTQFSKSDAEIPLFVGNSPEKLIIALEGLVQKLKGEQHV